MLNHIVVMGLSLIHILMQPQMHIQKLLYGCGTNLLLERICVQIKLPHLGELVSCLLYTSRCV